MLKGVDDGSQLVKILCEGITWGNDAVFKIYSRHAVIKICSSDKYLLKLNILDAAI